VRDLFEQAKKNSPSIVFIDEIDAVGRHRGAGLGGGHDEREQTLNQLLVEMDGFGVNEGVIVIAATNRPDILDKALLRPGRFDRFIEVPLPNIDGRREILKIHTKNMSLDEEADIDLLADLTDELSGADLKAVCTEAGMFAIRDKRDKVMVADFMDAIDKVMSKSKEDELFKSEAGMMFG
jgi:proteasome regulatory subunit